MCTSRTLDAGYDGRIARNALGARSYVENGAELSVLLDQIEDGECFKASELPTQTEAEQKAPSVAGDGAAY